MMENAVSENAVAVLEEIIMSRRSVRLFDQTPVPQAVIEQSLRMALNAPSSSNMQPWEFIWVKTPHLKQALVKACLSQAAATTAAELIVCVAHTRTWKRSREDVLKRLEEHERQGGRIPAAAFDYYRKIVPMMYTQGPLGVIGWLKRVSFFFTGLRKPSMREPVSQRDMEVWAVKSAALACENFMLAIRAHGFDTCPMEGFDSVRVRKLVNLPSGALIPMVMAIGKRGPKGVTLPPIRSDRSFFIKTL